MVRVGNCSAPVEPGKEVDGFGLGLGEGDSGLETGEQGERVALHADVVHDDRAEEIDLRSRREDSAEVEGLGKDADHGGGVTIERDGLAYNGAVAVKLALPEG